MNKNVIIILISLLVFFYSCDKINDPYIPMPVKEWYGKRAIIEDYTGHFCPNCPDAAAMGALIDSIYGDKVIIVAVHSNDYFSKPRPNLPEDFRTEAGTAWYNFFGIASAGLPNGMINRTGFPQKSHIVYHDLWPSKVSKVLSQIPEMDIEINASYDTVAKKLSGTVTTKFLKTIKKKLMIQLLITEDSIIAPQQNHTNIDPNYVHRHMLRDVVNGIWGAALTNGLAANTVNSEINYNFSYSLKQNFPPDTPGINWKHASLVVFIYDADNYEILQANQVHFKN